MPLWKKCYRAVLRLVGLEMCFPIVWRDQLASELTCKSGKQKSGKISSLAFRPVRCFLNALRPKREIIVETEQSKIGGQPAMHVRGGGRFDGMARPYRDPHGSGENSDKDLASVSVEYPYHYLQEALIERGFGNLARYVAWRGSSGKIIPERTKHAINLFKTKLEFCSVPAFQSIAINEAHVRLASSVWYAALYIVGPE
jgi:hypothetical protein